MSAVTAMSRTAVVPVARVRVAAWAASAAWSSARSFAIDGWGFGKKGLFVEAAMIARALMSSSGTLVGKFIATNTLFCLLVMGGRQITFSEDRMARPPTERAAQRSDTVECER